MNKSYFTWVTLESVYIIAAFVTNGNTQLGKFMSYDYHDNL